MDRNLGKADQIYEQLRRAIVRLDMAPGSAIAEKDICARFDVSRTPVREALQRLAEEDLVDIFPHSGTWVSRISFALAEEGFVLRRALEEAWSHKPKRVWLHTCNLDHPRAFDFYQKAGFVPYKFSAGGPFDQTLI